MKTLYDFNDPYGFKMPGIVGTVTAPVNPPPPVLNDGNTVAWYDSSDLTTLTLDGANRVSRWNDLLLSGRDLIQANGADQPLWSANGVLFDGVTEFMKAAPFAYIQPEMIYIVLRQVTWFTPDFFFDGNINSRGIIYQVVGSPILQAYAGIVSANNANLAINTFGIIRVLFNGAASTFQINLTAQLAGNYGALNMGGFTLGARADGTAEWSNIEVKEVILRNVVDAAPAQTAIYNYLSVKYGI